MKITGPVKWYEVSDRPVMQLEVDGVPAYFSEPDKLLRFGGVFLSPEHAPLTSFTVPADPADNRTEQVVPGATGDQEVVTLVRDFFDAVDDGTFAPREFAPPSGVPA
jgi:hypothetical protein